MRRKMACRLARLANLFSNAHQLRCYSVEELEELKRAYPFNAEGKFPTHVNLDIFRFHLEKRLGSDVVRFKAWGLEFRLELFNGWLSGPPRPPKVFRKARAIRGTSERYAAILQTLNPKPETPTLRPKP